MVSWTFWSFIAVHEGPGSRVQSWGRSISALGPRGGPYKLCNAVSAEKCANMRHKEKRPAGKLTGVRS